MMAVFVDAAELSQADRPAFIANACGSDAALRAEVESLLAAHDADAQFLESPLARPADTPDLGVQLQAALGTTFRVERELARGGMSRVFVAEETRLGRHVAVKVLSPELRAGLSMERFHRETRLAAALRHPHIVPLLAAGESEDGLVYYTMPYIAGESLQQRLEREGRLELADVVAIVGEVADALAYAHANGVVHRDIKPANVLIDGGHVVVADFGVAKAIAAARGEWDRAEQTDGAHEVSSSLTVVGSAIGTPAYMSPEQARAEEVDARTDVYSLGCMAFEMLTGQLPFGSAGVYGIADPEVEPPPAASTHCPGLPPAVDGVLARALAHNVDARFQSTTALAEALGAVAAQAAGTDGGATALPGSAWRPRWVAAAALAGAAVIVAGGVALRRVWTAFPSAAAGSTAAANASRSGAVTAPDGGPKLAVLPFENLGPQEDAYFAQGVGDGLASRLTSVAGVRVISPASTRQYRNTTKPAVQVGRELGVEYLLGGRVRWDRADQGPRRMRVTVELVRASDGRSVWADRYDATTDDLFAVEGTIGERVTRALAVALGARERQTISTRPTTSFEAYTYFLRGEALRTDWVDEYKAKINAVTLYERAVSLDPKFALAFARLAETHGNIYWASVDRTAKRLTLMRDAAETAVRLDPDLAEGHLALGYYYYRAQRDYDRALREFAAGLERQPGRAELFIARGAVLRRRGRLPEAAADFVRAVELDPRSPEPAWALAGTYGLMRAYADDVRYCERTLALNPGWSRAYADLALAFVRWRGDVMAARRVLRDGMALPDAGKILDRLRFQAPMFVGFTAVDSAVLRNLTVDMFRGDTAEFMVWKADWAHRHGEPARRRIYADSARTIFERQVAADPGEAGRRVLLALAYAHLGRKADALREGARAVEILPVARDAVDGADIQVDFAYVEMLVGESDAAVRRIAYLLSIPSDFSVPQLRVDPMWDPLRSNPGFQRLVGAGK